MDKKHVKKIGFICASLSPKWMGGVNYFKNLLFALSTYKENNVELFLFFGKKSDKKIIKLLEPYATIIQDSVFDRKSIKWYFDMACRVVLDRKLFTIFSLKKYGITHLSHSGTLKHSKIKTYPWIPDFQHIHLPQFFSDKEINARNKAYERFFKYGTQVILSSYDAQNDAEKFIPKYKNKAKVLQFVSQPDPSYFSLEQKDFEALKVKYNLPNEFYYLPNQFWQHKNHLLVFKAVRELKKLGREIVVICTGHLNDSRNKDYIEVIRNFIHNNNLEKNILLLGLIEYREVYTLMKYSIAVINPSLFEGWSSTVEECKSVGKNMILSDINVHMEQYAESDFFEKDSHDSIVNLIRFNLQSKKIFEIENIITRTNKFSDNYYKIIETI